VVLGKGGERCEVWSDVRRREKVRLKCDGDRAGGLRGTEARLPTEPKDKRWLHLCGGGGGGSVLEFVTT